MTISEFRNNMGVALKQLPVELWDSKSKKVVGVVSMEEDYTSVLRGAAEKPLTSPNVTKKVKKSKLLPVGEMCIHNLSCHEGCHYEK